MALTVAQYLSAMRHAIGGDDPAAGVDLLQTLNDSIRELFDAHDWNWSVVTASVSTVAAQNYAALPADFGELISLLDSEGNSIPIKNIGLIQGYRNGAARRESGTVAALSHPAQASVSAARGRARIEIYPTPGSNGTLTLVYRSCGTPVSADTDIPNIPAEYETALRLLARGNVLGLERGDWSERDRGMAILDSLAGVDGSESDEFGQIDGGILPPGRMGE